MTDDIQQIMAIECRLRGCLRPDYAAWSKEKRELPPSQRPKPKPAIMAKPIKPPPARSARVARSAIPAAIRELMRQRPGKPITNKDIREATGLGAGTVAQWVYRAKKHGRCFWPCPPRKGTAEFRRNEAIAKAKQLAVGFQQPEQVIEYYERPGKPDRGEGAVMVGGESGVEK